MQQRISNNGSYVTWSYQDDAFTGLKAFLYSGVARILCERPPTEPPRSHTGGAKTKNRAEGWGIGRWCPLVNRVGGLVSVVSYPAGSMAESRSKTILVLSKCDTTPLLDRQTDGVNCYSEVSWKNYCGKSRGHVLQCPTAANANVSLGM